MEGTSWASEQSQRTVQWIRDQVHAAGAGGVVVGLSGGVDSAVVAGLAKRAFPDSTTGLIMPCHSMPTDAQLAHEVAAKFDIPCLEVTLDQPFDSLHAAFTSARTGLNASRLGLADANIKPRLRMITLYYFANLLNRLVLGTGNRTELMVGYFTKYGDGGVDLLPLGGLVKHQVYALARYLGVPESVTSRPPSAGLWEGQTDEAEIGLSYELMDAYLLRQAVPEPVSEQMMRLSRISEHKRKPAPIGPTVHCETKDDQQPTRER